jgi:hypothetical protein
MKTSTIKFSLQKLLILAAIFLTSHLLDAQCSIKYTGSLCVGSNIVFEGQGGGSTHEWECNGVKGNSFSGTISYAFKTPGLKNIKYITTINGSKCTSDIQVTIKTSPVPKLTALSANDQCYKSNLFCFGDSTKNPNGSPIRSVKYLLGDGQYFQNASVITPFCFSIKDVRGGCFDLIAEYTDANGCSADDTIICAAKVKESISAAATSNKPIGCDSVSATFNNLTRISQSKVKSITWNWGDGTSSSQWGPTIKKQYSKDGAFTLKLLVVTLDGCVDSFEIKNAATVYKYSVFNIVSNKDSTCISNPDIQFSLSPQPQNISNFLWNFGDPPSGPQNFNNRLLSVAHSFTGLGPYQVKFSCDVSCGGTTFKKILYDTVLIIGPQSTIEIPFNRIAEYEVFQCPKDVQDTVHFKNFSKFYHNDKNQWNDDSTFKKWAGNKHPGHVFDNNQAWVKPKGFVDPLYRQRGNAVRIWDFGDTYGPNCTTDRRNNRNVNVNCRYSHDSLPAHYYKSWDLVSLSEFKNAPMEDAIFLESTRLCKKINIWPSDTNYIIEDTILVVPKSSSDIAMANQPKYIVNRTKNFLQEKGVGGPAERFITDFVNVQLKTGESAFVGTQGGTFVKHTGPKTILLTPNQIIKLISKTDSFRFLFTAYLKRDTLPLPLLKIRQMKGERPRLISFYKRTFPGVSGIDYKIDYKRWRLLYYAKIPACHNVKLIHFDTLHALACRSESIKQLSMAHANAGGVGSRLLKESVECLGGKNPLYGVTFLLSDLKPGCTFSYVSINYDTFCKPSNWTTLTSGLTPGSRPPGMPYMGYQIASNPPSRFSKQYSASEVCNPNGCITVGIIVGNGVKKGGTVGDPPLCSDTQIYDKFACFPKLDASFEIITPTPNALSYRKICVNDPVVVSTTLNNKTKSDDLKALRWEFATGNAGSNYRNYWSYQIEEEYYRGYFLKDSGTKKIYNYIVKRQYEQQPVRVPCSSDWANGSRKLVKKPDTIITAIITKWDTAADVAAVWERMVERLEAKGFDPFALDLAQINRMIWNNKGIIGQPLTGAQGCIDTNGFGNFINFSFRPIPGFKKIVHNRDTSIKPMDTAVVGTKKYRAYTFRSPWSGYHLASMSMTSANGKCDDVAAFPVMVGFAAMIELSDSITNMNNGQNLQGRLDLRYFHPDPLNFGQWDTYDYWRDAQRQADIFMGKKNRESFTRWDWNKRDDNLGIPSTKFGGAPYGATGVGNPWFALGGGPSAPKTIYYKNDSGVYTMRVAVGDSSGCKDTISRRLFITKLKSHFGWRFTEPNCKSEVELLDSSKLFDPCNWALKGCNGKPIACDYINYYLIQWGDGTQNYFKRDSLTAPLLPSSIKHKYAKSGNYTINVLVKSQKGGVDSVKQIVNYNNTFSVQLRDTMYGQLNKKEAMSNVIINPMPDSTNQISWYILEVPKGVNSSGVLTENPVGSQSYFMNFSNVSDTGLYVFRYCVKDKKTACEKCDTTNVFIFSGSSALIKSPQNTNIRFNVWPNPINEGSWSMSALPFSYKYTLFDANGKIILVGYAQKGQSGNIATASLSKGFYNLLIEIPEMGSASLKLIKQ